MFEKINVIVIAAFLVFAAIIITGLLGLLIAFLIVWLWNMCLPQLFGITPIAYWQAWSLYLLVMIFAGLFHSKLEK